jgi:hypothetical protein
MVYSRRKGRQFTQYRENMYWKNSKYEEQNQRTSQRQHPALKASKKDTARPILHNSRSYFGTSSALPL